MERPNELKYYSANDQQSEQGYRTIYFNSSHKYGNTLIFRSPTMGTGYVDSMVNEMHDMLTAIENEEYIEPSFYDGWRVNRVIDAIIESSTNSRWVEV
jgi:predicted dehydrogenase